MPLVCKQVEEAMSSFKSVGLKLNPWVDQDFVMFPIQTAPSMLKSAYVLDKSPTLPAERLQAVDAWESNFTSLLSNISTPGQSYFELLWTMSNSGCIAVGI